MTRSHRTFRIIQTTQDNSRYPRQFRHTKCGVDLKRVPPKSRPARQHASCTATYTRPARRDSAVHVSLSSDSHVKQPGAIKPHSSQTARRRQNSPPDIDLGCTTPTMPLSCRGAPFRRAAARRVCPVYRTTPDSLSSAQMEITGRRHDLPRHLSVTSPRNTPSSEGRDRSLFNHRVAIRFLQAWQRPTLPSLET